MNNKDLIIQNRNRIYRICRDSAKLLKEVDCKVSSIEIDYTMTFLSGVCPIQPLVEKVLLTPDDKLFLYIPCLNKDCTGNGFYLTDQIERAIHLRQVITGEINCGGKEDWKYLDSRGCSCLTTLQYTITPVFKQ